jgi:hypothetical protein
MRSDSDFGSGRQAQDSAVRKEENNRIRKAQVLHHQALRKKDAM